MASRDDLTERSLSHSPTHRDYVDDGMESHGETHAADELLAQLGWVRALAQSLVRDPDVADEVLQRVCLLALQKAPRERRSGLTLQAWLATVTRRLAWHGSRADRRRQRHERGAARPEALPSTVDDAVHREALRGLVEAVTSLEQPYYSAIVARYFEGRTVAEMAELEHASPEAIRQRLSRARRRLRSQLEALLADDRRAWLLAALPRSPAPAALGGGVAKVPLAYLGGIVVAKSASAVATAICLGLVVAGAVLFLRSDERPGETRPAVQVVLPSAPEAGSAGLPDAPTLAVESAVPAQPVAKAGSAAATLPGEDARFTGRVVDEKGVPIAGAIVSHVPTRKLRRPLGLVTGASNIDLAWERLPQTISGADGRFSFSSRELPRDPDAPPDPDVDAHWAGVYGGGTPGLVVHHPDYEIRVHACTGFRSGAYDAGDIVLPPGQAVLGRLVTPEGGFVGDADVGLPPNMTASMVQRTGDPGVAASFLHVTSGPDGRFRLGSLGPGLAFLDVRHPDFVPWGQRMTIEAGVVLDLGDIQLEPARHIRGVVLGADGQPLRGAWVLARGSAQRMDMVFGGADPLSQEIGSTIGTGAGGHHEVRVSTDAKGTFDLGTLNQTYYDVFAKASGCDPACLRDVQAGTDGVVLALPGQALLLISVVDSAARVPLADATAQAWRRSETKGLFGGRPELQTLTGAAAAAAAGLEDDGLGLIVVQRAGDEGTDVVLSAPGRATTGFALPGVRPGQQLARTLELSPESVLEGLVQDAERTPVAGANLTLSWPAGQGVQLPPRKATSDAQGRFRFDQLLPGAWTLSASAQGFLDQWGLPQPVTDSAKPQQTVITLDRGGSLQGLLVGVDGAPAPDVEVDVALLEGPRKGQHLQETSGSTGRFTFEALPPGPVTVTAWPGAEAQVTLVTGETNEITLALRRQPIVRGRVTRVGQPVGEAKVVGRTVSPRTPGSPITSAMTAENRARLFGTGDVKASTSATGEYELEFTQSGAHILQAQAGGARSRAVSVTVDWDRVEVVDLVFGTAGLAGLVTDARSGQPVEGAAVSLHDRTCDADLGLEGLARASELDLTDRSNENGRFAFQQLLPGAYTVKVEDASFVTATREALLAPDGTLSVDGAATSQLVLALEPGPVLEGTVRMASGKPLLPDLCIGLEVEGHLALDRTMNLNSAAPSAAWTWPWSPAPGPCTVKVWRSISAQLGTLAPEDVLFSVPVNLVAGETSVVELVIGG
ncbi:MAG TPA: sigma-70 family RNA polymerase sigma factor [Planctomycetota bacterium]|nr:sigma-70 family RNA polymerase sigma factor [Planctomycetota bacterium]